MIYVPQARIYHKVSASTGMSTGTSQYYSIRNKYKMIDNNYHGLYRFIAKLFSTEQCIFRCMKGELRYMYFKKALMAYKHGESGMTKASL